jgi:hypothetical protein
MTGTQSPPPVLYHYCPLQGFMGILQSKSFWLGQLSTMNDYMEHSWLKKIALERLDELQAESRLLDATEQAMRTRFYSALQIQLQTVAHFDPYCACFSEDGDVLSQWRAYADDGRGFMPTQSREHGTRHRRSEESR